jgi:hypothetical protein
VFSQLIVFQRFYDFILILYPVINRLPKNHRSAIGVQIERVSINILISIIYANSQTGLSRQSTLKIISQNLDVLRIVIRLTKDLRFISLGQYQLLSQKLNEIAKLFSSWSKVK